MCTLIKMASYSSVFLVLVAMTAKTNSQSACAGFLCDSGQCVGRSSFCNGNCDCGDCSDEKRQNCPYFSSPNDGDKSGPTLGPGSTIGIIVAAICIFLLLIAALIVFLVCRIRREALKNSRMRRARLDPSTLGHGCALPVDIPIEALTREPPPQYTPRSEIPTGTSLSPNQFTINVLPPPYYSPAGANSTVEMSYTCEAPPKYQSVADLRAPSTGPHPKKEELNKESSEPRRNSVDSFVGVPSMSSILLTSSRSSVLVGGQSSSPGDDRRPGRGPSQGDSARGESIASSRSRQSTDCATASNSSRSLDIRSRSRSLSNILSDSIEIPEHGLQKSIHDSDNTRTSACPPYRSVPALECAVRTRDRTQGRPTTSRSPDTSGDTNRKQKQGRYHKRRESQKTEVREDDNGEQNPTSGTSSQRFDPGPTNGLTKSKKQISRSLPQLATLQEARWEEIGSCDV